MALTLDGTDGASKLSDSAMAAQDIYAKDNILGTVSQSGGIPTGAIIERDSNANGEYVKFADGTMICIHATETVGTGESQWAYPAVFSDIATFMGVTVYSGSPTSYSTRTDNPAISSFNFQVTNLNTGISAIPVRLIAIGRWY